MQISVIIPVYNAEQYIRQAVESAVSQPETGEVILIEDSSQDHSLCVCEKLAEEYAQVTLLRHPDLGNHGASASRNLGIQAAKCEYIAFLDADDFYLPTRFKEAREKLEQSPNVDGIYEAIGTYFQNEESEKAWSSVGRSGDNLTTISQKIEPSQLFDNLIRNESIGWFHANGLVVRKDLFERTGYFDEYLEFSEDVVMWVKMAAVGNLLPGRLNTPVAMRRVHGQNSVIRFHDKLAYYSNIPRWKTLLIWGYRSNLPLVKLSLLFDKYSSSSRKEQMISNNAIRRTLDRIKFAILLFSQHPELLYTSNLKKIYKLLTI